MALLELRPGLLNLAPPHIRTPPFKRAFGTRLIEARADDEIDLRSVVRWSHRRQTMSKYRETKKEIEASVQFQEPATEEKEAQPKTKHGHRSR